MNTKGKLILVAILAILAGAGLFSAYGGWFSAVVACAVGTVALPLMTFALKGRHPYTIWAVWALVGMGWGVTAAGVALYVEAWLLAVPPLLLAVACAYGVFRLVDVMLPDIAIFAAIMGGQPANTPAVRARLAALGAYYAKLNAVRAKVGLRPLGATGAYTQGNNPHTYWKQREADGTAPTAPPPVNRAERRRQAAEERKRK